MRIENQLYRKLQSLKKCPKKWLPKVQTIMMGRFVPFLATAGVQFDHISREEVRVSIRNQRKAQNHIKGVHACAMALLAETATGFATILNTPDDKLILLKSMNINYVARSQGNMSAIARISEADAQRIIQEERGNFIVPCQVFDESDESPIEVEMTWAWLPKKPKE